VSTGIRSGNASIICETLASGENVKFSGFGTFTVRSKGERLGRNPKTGIKVPIDRRRVMVFKPSNVLKAHVNGEATGEEDLVGLKLSGA
jgi:integration host factor subunit alpha